MAFVCIVYFICIYLLITCQFNNIEESFRKAFDPCYYKLSRNPSYNPKLEYFIAEDRVCVNYNVGCWTSVRVELKTLRGADPQTFEILDHNYGKDKNNVYYLNKKVKGADPDTFTVTDDLPWPIVQDKNYTYYGGERR